MKNKRALVFVALAVFCTVMGTGIGYVYTTAKYGKGTVQADEQENTAEIQVNEYTPTSMAEEKITPSTKMVYQYYYTEDGVTEVQEDIPPYFMLDLTLSEISKYYTTWDIVSFSPKEVVMRKTIVGASQQRYVVGQKDGYVAVYYEEEQEGISLKELTGIPVDGLSEDEKLRLNQGIKVMGNEALARTLENYSS
ncbi:MAG: BofC C-terminal domain-containing protein [Anaerotignaceae bacterium]